MIVLNKNLINPLFDIIKSFHITLLLKELNFKGKFTAIKRSKAMQIILFPTSYICKFCSASSFTAIRVFLISAVNI